MGCAIALQYFGKRCFKAIVIRLCKIYRVTHIPTPIKKPTRMREGDERRLLQPAGVSLPALAVNFILLVHLSK
jgi:hypothetical protein